MIELYDWTGELLGGAVDWRWPAGGKEGRLLGVMIPEKSRYRFLVVASDQEQVRLRWRLTVDGTTYRAVAGRILDSVPLLRRWDGGEMNGPLWFITELGIAVTGAAD